MKSRRRGEENELSLGVTGQEEAGEAGSPDTERNPVPDGTVKCRGEDMAEVVKIKL